MLTKLPARNILINFVNISCPASLVLRRQHKL
jgi:hypothetical protein